jgi:tetratricopeptide (TPR) repeat protein
LFICRHITYSNLLINHLAIVIHTFIIHFRKKKLKYCLIWSFWGLSNCLFAQTTKIDSLLNLLVHTRSPQAQVEILTDIAYKYTTVYPDSSLYYLAKAEKIAQKNNNLQQIARIYNHRGLAYFDKGNLAKALYFFKTSLDLAKKINNVNLEGRNLGNLGLLYLGTGSSSLAIHYYREAWQIFEKIGNQERMALTLSNIGNAYLDLNKYDSAKFYIEQALPLTQKYAPIFQAFAWYNSGKIKLYQKQYELAQKDTYQALALARYYDDKQDLVLAHLLLAEIQLAQNQLDSALTNTQTAIKIAQTSQRRRDIYFAYHLYSQILAKQKNFEQALQYRDLSLLYKDSLQTETISNALQVFEYEKKQSEIALIKAQQTQKDREYRQQITTQQTIVVVSVLALGLMIGVALIIFSSRQKIKKTNQKLQAAYQDGQEKQEEILAQNEELRHQQTEISNLNNHLEDLVKEKTATILARNAQLNEYAHFNAHQLRAPIATIMGLYEVLKLNPSLEDREFICKQIEISILVLDEMVRKSQSLLEEDE